MLGADRLEVAFEHHILADEDSVADGHRQAHCLVVGVSDPQGEAATIECCFQFHYDFCIICKIPAFLPAYVVEYTIEDNLSINFVNFFVEYCEVYLQF